MASPDEEDKPAASPLDAERAKLRKDGYTDAEISQILIARASGSSQQSAGAGGQGVLSNTLNSIVAVAGHARAALPSFKRDFAAIFSRDSSAAARAGASVALALKAIVIAVLGYAVWQEWQQHIISATEIAAIQARKLRAEECSARAESNAKNMHMADILNGTYRGDEDLARDCDPNYGHRKALEAACTEKFKAIFSPLDTFTSFDPRLSEFNKTLKDKITAYKAECSVTDANKDYAREHLATLRKIAGLPATTEDEPKSASRSDAPAQSQRAPPPVAPVEQKSAALVPVQKQPAPSPSFKTYDNFDVIGGDRATLKNVELADCVAACRGDSECIAYSYDKWNKWCFTKTATNELTYSARSLTALREDAPAPTYSRSNIHFDRYRNKGFPRQPQQSRPAQSFEQCEAMCGQAEWCAALTFYRSTRECQLLRTTSEYFSNPDAYSAAKSQAN